MIEFMQVNRENFWDITGLSVKKEQEDYILSNAMSIAQAYVQEECIPLGIFAEGRPVGFLMYCIDVDDGEYWLYRLMIDAAQQGKGYARAAMEELLQIVKKDPARNKMFLGVHTDSAEAVSLYHSLGFRFDGQVFGQEHIMELKW